MTAEQLQIMWNKIVGHKKQIGLLRKAIEGGNIHHSYLLTGIDGIGKSLVAKAAAWALLGSDPGKNHPDLIYIEPENDIITIDRVRDVKDGLKFAPYQAAHRVIIIDRAEAMNANAANAALKILEEPPAGNHFFLITSMPDRLLPTIISRCQRIEFSPIAAAEIAAYLMKEHGYSREQAETAASISEGSVGRALGITPDLISRVTLDLAQLLKSPTASGILELSSKWAGQKGEIGGVLYVIHRCFHAAMVQKGAGEGGDITSVITSRNSRARLVEKCNAIAKTHNLVTTAFNKQLMFEQLLFSLAG